MSHGMILKKAVAATDVGSYNRYAIAASSLDLDNGNVFRLDTCASSTSGCSTVYTEAWTVSAGSASGSTLSDMWMAGQEGVNILVDGTLQYAGINDDPRKFYNIGAKVFTAFKPQVGDVIEFSADCFVAAPSGTSIYASSNGDVYTLVCAAAAVAGSLAFKLLATTYFSIGNGVLGSTGRVAAYRMVCVAN